MCPELIEFLSWNGPTVHVCCFMLERASTKTFASRVQKTAKKNRQPKKSLAGSLVGRGITVFDRRLFVMQCACLVLHCPLIVFVPSAFGHPRPMLRPKQVSDASVCQFALMETATSVPLIAKCDMLMDLIGVMKELAGSCAESCVPLCNQFLNLFLQFPGAMQQEIGNANCDAGSAYQTPSCCTESHSFLSSAVSTRIGSIQ